VGVDQDGPGVFVEGGKFYQVERTAASSGIRAARIQGRPAAAWRALLRRLVAVELEHRRRHGLAGRGDAGVGLVDEQQDRRDEGAAGGGQLRGALGGDEARAGFG
jgi:hypothetical protein